MTKNDLAVVVPDRYVIGDRPVHIHQCRGGDGHTWSCNSPYCNFMQADCPEHGGPPVIIQGLEPWRGRL